MAVRFDGRTTLLTDQMQPYFTANHGYPRGMVSYWFQATDIRNAAILQVFPYFPSGQQCSGYSTVRVEHFMSGTSAKWDPHIDPSIEYGLTVFLQNSYEVNEANPAYFSVMGFVPRQNFLPFYDGNWHHVLIAWKIDVTPVLNIWIDGVLQLVIRDRYSGNGYPNAYGTITGASTGALEFAGPNRFAGPVKWSVGTDQFDGFAPFLGNLERVVLYAGTEDLTDISTQTHCDAILVNKKHGTTDAGHEPVAVPMIPDGYYVFCRTTPNKQETNITDPEHAQLSLSGGATTFPKNYGSAFNPFGLSTTFSVTGALTDAPTSP